LISVEDALKAHESLPTDQLRFIDGSWFLKGRNARAEYEEGPRIPNSVFLDIDDCSGDGGPKNLPHMMPTKELFGAWMDAHGITNNHHLIVYGSKDCMFVHRAWMELLCMGHARDRVHLMQGSLYDWEQQGGPLDTSKQTVLSASELDLSKATTYVATDPQSTVNLNDMKQIVSAQSDIVVDVRSKERFLAQVDEPRPNLRLGHMPGALNLPFLELLNPDNVNQYKPENELRDIFAKAGLNIDSDKRIVASCGSGATACTLAGALFVCGRDPSKTFIYDGSWMDWASEDDTPIVKED
jgi:thiosulfate/3-mercaptopyruvate sulfurtransferase